MRSEALKYLLDCVIDHCNGIACAMTFLKEHGNKCALSAISRDEMLTGFDVET